MKKIIIMLLTLILLCSCATQPDDSSVVDTPMANKGYSFSEIDILYGPGPFSVNELAEIFGEPTFLTGYHSRDGVSALCVSFKDIQFDLIANNGEELSYALTNDPPPVSDSSGFCSVEESDKSVRMKPICSWVSGEKWPLPRNMKIGDSREQLTHAYNGDMGQENTAEGQLAVAYGYGQSGYIAYIFYDDKLNSVSITWYDGNI